MMEAAEENKTTTTTSVTLNVGYPTSWQGVLKIAKCVFLFCCLVCSAIIVNTYRKYTYQNVSIAAYDYCLAISVIGFLSELIVFILYIAGVNKKWSTNAVCGILMMIYHLLMLICIFAACIVMTGVGTYYYSNTAAAQAYNAFGIFTIMGFSLDVYFNIIWMRGGPELAALSIPGQ